MNRVPNFETDSEAHVEDKNGVLSPDEIEGLPMGDPEMRGKTEAGNGFHVGGSAFFEAPYPLFGGFRTNTILGFP